MLLSPACASFDMFKNYVHRAEVFVAQCSIALEGGRMITSMLNRERINAPSYDQGLLWVLLSLLGLGLVMVYSASIAIAEADKGVGHNSSYYLVHQAISWWLSALHSWHLMFPSPGGKKWHLICFCLVWLCWC